MKERNDIPPKYIACLIDISGYFTDTEPGKELLAQCGGKIFYSGFFDDSVNVHLCSLTPAVYVEVLELVPETIPEDDAVSEELWNALNLLHTADDSGYYNRREIERMKEQSPDHFKVLDCTFEADDTDETRMDVVREDLQGSPVF